jgi:hypothetical protein
MWIIQITWKTKPKKLFPSRETWLLSCKVKQGISKKNQDALSCGHNLMCVRKVYIRPKPNKIQQPSFSTHLDLCHFFLPRTFLRELICQNLTTLTCFNPHHNTNSCITIMSIVHIEEHSILVIRNDSLSVAKLTFHLTPLVQNYGSHTFCLHYIENIEG